MLFTLYSSEIPMRYICIKPMVYFITVMHFENYTQHNFKLDNSNVASGSQWQSNTVG